MQVIILALQLNDDSHLTGRQFTYDHDEYWPVLLQVCLDRREAYRRAWRKLGGAVGQSEWDFKRAAWDDIVKSASNQPIEQVDAQDAQAVTPSTSSGPTVVPSPAEGGSPSGSD